jgi:hypothetical protein
MIDRTSVGITPLLSTPVTTSYVTPSVQTTSFVPAAVTQPVAFAQTSVPVTTTTYTTSVVDQGLTVPAATTSYVPDPGFGVSVVPQTTLPDQTFTTVIPDATPTYVPTPDVQTVSVVPDAGLQTIQSQVPVATTVDTTLTPEIVSSVPVPQTTYATTTVGGTPLPQTTYSTTTAGGTPLPQTTYTTTTAGGTPVPPPAPQNAPLGPIMDEDFQRGRPIYDTFSEDRYRGFRFGR